jgi:hypothetical protein
MQTLKLYTGRKQMLIKSPSICAWMIVAALTCAWHTSTLANEKPIKNRLFVLTDIGNEPDDQMSFVRLLVYSNELDIEGLVATTSTWQRNHTRPHTLQEIITTYGKVRPNLMRHSDGWPDTKHLLSLVSSGQPAYGMAAVGKGKSTDGSRALIKAADRYDDRPLWINLWGGANTLAQALWDIRATRSAEEVAAFVSRLRVYSISDQDDAGLWIRKEFPQLFYIVMPSSQDSEDYYYATWTGIAGDVFYRNGMGADGSMITNEWLETNIRKGPLGKHYPKFEYIMEGDTPAFLGLVNNGLASHHSPSWGGWGGRYVYRQPYGESRPIWTQGGGGGGITSQDEVVGIDGKNYVSDHATIWRWRNAFQRDFAARMNWTIKTYEKANHHPVVVVNGVKGNEPLNLSVNLGEILELDASGSSDPDNDQLSYRWIIYPEAGFEPDKSMAVVELDKTEGHHVTLNPLKICRNDWHNTNPKCAKGLAHVILEVTDNGSPALTRYRRIVIDVNQNTVP